ncbi:MAG: hypothetical protein AAB531_03550 [Patescibacteria group bacterium]
MSKTEFEDRIKRKVLDDISLGFHKGLPEKTVNVSVAFILGPHTLEEIAESYGEVHSNISYHLRRFTRKLEIRRSAFEKDVRRSINQNIIKLNRSLVQNSN